jgi:hypothetical protein
MESPLYEDLNQLNSLANRHGDEKPPKKRRYGLSLNHKKAFVTQFMSVDPPGGGGGDID